MNVSKAYELLAERKGDHITVQYKWQDESNPESQHSILEALGRPIPEGCVEGEFTYIAEDSDDSSEALIRMQSGDHYLVFFVDKEIVNIV